MQSNDLIYSMRIVKQNSDIFIDFIYKDKCFSQVNYTSCTIQGPNNADVRPQCAISVDGNNRALTWSFCVVPTDAVIFYSTVSKNGYWTENSGSTEGATMLWIYGNRFAQNGFSTVPSTTNRNTVQLVSNYAVYDCEMHNDKVTNTQLTCYTPAMAPGVYQIRAYVNGNLIPLYQYSNPQRATFVPLVSQTPTITGISPQTGPPQTLISLSGNFRTACTSRDVNGCSMDGDPLISRVYMGGHLCNVINPVTNTYYSNVTDNNLKCSFEGNEIGIFNVSMLVTEQYGRSSISPNLYRVSAAGNLYTFQSYAVISSVSPNTGSLQGGTTLTINGENFCNNAQYPVVVNVGGQPCTVLNASLTTIQCQTPVAPVNIASQYHGGRGVYIFRQSGAIAQGTLAASSPPYPSVGATQTWSDDAMYVSQSSSDEAVWLIGFLRIPKAANFTFTLQTNGNGALFLSSNDSPANVVKIADVTNNQSNTELLQGNMDYYLLCVGSRLGGNLVLSVEARMHETTLTATTSRLVLNEIQSISVIATVVAEEQRIFYSTNAPSNGTSEVQSIQAGISTFQIGFRGAYTALLTGQPTTDVVEAALNDLPTIYPHTVTVTATSTLYIITFPSEMGNVPLVTCISTSGNAPVINETVQGVASNTAIAFSLNGMTTDYIDFTTNVTQANLMAQFNKLFSILCPISINNAQATQSIVYLQDFETGCVFDETNIRSNAFCGQCSLTSNTLVTGNTRGGNYLCFAYKISNSYVTQVDVGVYLNGDITTKYWPSIPFTPIADGVWHYTCIDVFSTLSSQSSTYSSASSIVLNYAALSENIQQGISIDAVTVRTALPIGYEPQSLHPIDQTNISSCVFPFIYNGQSYSACTLGNNEIPICLDRQNNTNQCQSTSIEGARRLYPEHQLVYNTLQVAYTPSTSTINVSFRYGDCSTPSLIQSLPSTSATSSIITTASNATSGTFDLVFNGQTYSSIPVNIATSDLAVLLQSSPDFGFLSVTRSRDCTGYLYLIEWVANGGQKSAISIANVTVTPSSATVTASIVQQGGVLYRPLPGDMTRTYNINPQVEVLVGGYPSQCVGNGTCDFRWLISQTPSISSISQNSMTVTITGTGFSATALENTVLIGSTGSCTVTMASITSITCTIGDAPSGSYGVNINVLGKGLATNNRNLTINVPLRITSFSPNQGGGGGGYILTVDGTGFSLAATVTVDGNTCMNPQVTNFSSITCTVPATTALNNYQATITVINLSNTVSASSQFTYNVTNTPNILSTSPSVFTVAGGLCNISGTLFGNGLPTVTIGSTQATVLSSSPTNIIVMLPPLVPGIYAVMILTANGYARPPIQIEYRLYVQQVSPQVGSLYGGTDVYVQGQGFDNTTSVNFVGNNVSVPCTVISFQATQIHCQTTAAAPQVTITSNGVDPVNGAGFAWSPQYATVQVGAFVQWQWGSSALLSSITYKVQQVSNGYSTTPLMNGFDSGNASASGTFSYQFQTPGIYYYWSTPVDQSGLISLRGVINVVAAQSQTLAVQVTSHSVTAQSCIFPFTFNSVTYASCTTINDTQQWCSPSPVYTGQRLYCTPSTSVPVSSCGVSSVINPSTCSQTVPTTNPLLFLFTPCSVGTVTSISPVQGVAGTAITITGTNFGTNNCENQVFIGSIYQCPITSVSSTQIVCQIGSNSSLDTSTIQNISVARDQQGFLINNGLLQFQFQASVTNFSPNQGSILGGTQVTISGNGFTPADTRIIIGRIDYTSQSTITYSQIIFTTPSVPSNLYINQAIPVTILIGTNRAICSSATCTFQWSTSDTPFVDSVTPTAITGTQILTLTGRNLAANPTAAIPSNTHVTINGTSCNVTSITNSTILCQISGVAAGNYSILVSIDGVGNAVSAARLISTAALSSVSPMTIGTNGDVLLTINGNGFSSNINNVQVNVGSSSCSIVQATQNQIQCIAPARGSNGSPAAISVISNGISFLSTLSLTYSTTITPTISSVSPTSGSASQLLTITGTNFVSNETSVVVGNVPCAISSVSTTSITCTVGSSPAGSQPVIVQVTSAGNSNSNVQFQYALQVNSVTPTQGSYGGGQLLTIVGDGFDGSNLAITLCSQACQSITVLSNTQVTCVTPAATASTSNTICSLTVSIGNATHSVSYTYSASLTARVTFVSPTRGGTGGGTTLTITGTNFPTALGAISVSIAGVSCNVQSVSQTVVICFTGSYSATTIQAPVIVSMTNAGIAAGSVQFQYINLWSSPWTWGGNPPPEAGELVVIDGGNTVYFDTTTPILKAIVIDNASVIFDDNQDVALNVEYILIVNNSLFQVGTESNPFQHQAIITMYGQLRSIELPIYGAKVLALRQGKIDMHGIDYGQTWTQLGQTANSGDSQITLRQAMRWPIGSQIIIPTTGDYESQAESEVRTITAQSSNGLILTLDAPLNFTHLGVSRNIGSLTVNARGEVGLLSHNILFQGSVTQTWNQVIQPCPVGFNPDQFAVQSCFLGRYGQEIGSDQFGATIMASGANSSDNTQDVILRLSNIEIFNVGQAFRLGRYPVHFHMNGNMSLSYIKSSSVYQSYNRAINIHASNYVTVEDNVIYNIMGGAIFLEDGVEVGNVLRGNLAVFVQTSSSLLNEDLTPAAIWATNPYNTIENNAVAGGTHLGYWYRMLKKPDGPSFAMYPGYCPYRQPFGRFFNNSVHSTGVAGVWIFPEYSPTVGGSCTNDAPTQAVFEGLISWKNFKGMEWVMASTIQIKSALVFDSSDAGLSCVTAINDGATNLPNLEATFYNENTGSSVIDSIIIGDLGVSGAPIVPTTAGLVVMWDRGLLVRNVSFINLPSPQTQALFGPIIIGRCVEYCGGWMTKFSQLSFTNVTNRGNFRWQYDGLYLDEDGSLGNVPGAMILSPDGLWNTSTLCSPTPNFLNAVTCPASVGNWIRFAFNNANLDTSGQFLFITDSQNSNEAVVPSRHKRLTHPSGYMMDLLTNRVYSFSFQNANTSVNLSYTGVVYNLVPGDYLIVQHGIEFMPDQVYTISSTSMAYQSSTPLSGATSNNGDWHYDNNTSLFSYIVKNPSSNTVFIDVTLVLNVIKCQYPNCQPPIQPGLQLPATARPANALYWSNDSDWHFATQGYGGYGSVKPGNNTNIYIPFGIWLVVDYPLPCILSLRIDGVLEFEQGMDNILTANSILINGGQLIVGWPNNPLNSSVDIIITGSTTTNVPLPNNAGTLGPTVIGVLGGLDLHGIPRTVSWTRLGATAASGQNTIVLSQLVDWVVGDEIIVTTTDTSIGHTERHTIASVNRTIITTQIALAYTHIVIDNVFPNGQVAQVAAAVGLLTRNVRVINRNPASDLFGFRILVTDYETNIWNPVMNQSMNTYYKGYARISDTQFIGYGQFVDAPNDDLREGIHLYNLGDWNASRPTYVDSCSFDGGSFSAIGLWSTNGVPITNNVVYNTYQSGIVAAGQNNIIDHNIVSTVYWSGTAQPQYAEFNVNNDGAIMSRDAISVVMQNNLVAGVERLAYRIQGNSCPSTVLTVGMNNSYWNNEAHSAMSGVNLWPMDTGFQSDLECVLITGFRTYKAWYYGIYINTARNIIIDSCSVIDGNVGIFTFVIGPPALSHVVGNNTITIQNSVVIGAITPNDCGDTVDQTPINILYSQKAVPTVSANSSGGSAGGRCGIVFPYMGLYNMMPSHPWSGMDSYPTIDGLMIVTNVTLAFFNFECSSRQDFAFQVGQHNDDGQFPITTNRLFIYNTSQTNLINSGWPNLDVVNQARCGDMDCDGLKKDLLIDEDGTLFGQPSSVFSDSEHFWGNQQHGVGDFRIPSVALADSTGQMINISSIYPYRGISRGPTCAYQPSWQMYLCTNAIDYRMLIMESMDSDTETRRLSPVAIMSDNGYIDLINGPEDHGWCNGFSCGTRISTFMLLIESGHQYLIYLSSTQPNDMRFRIINSNASVVNILALRYDSLQQIDVYANGIYVAPINQNTNYPYMMLMDTPNTLTLSSPVGSNFFNRTTQMAYFVIDGNTVIDLVISPLIVLTFGLPPQTPTSFFSGNLVANLAAFLGVPENMIVRVNIVSANNNTRVRRQSSNAGSYQLRVEIRSSPVQSLSGNFSATAQLMANLTSIIINQYQSGELQMAWANFTATSDTVPSSLTIQEPNNQISFPLSVIARIALVTPPASCREQSPCTTQPVLVAYDSAGNVIQNLGSIQYPWQVVASIVGQPNVTVPGAIANYTNGQTQYSNFGLPYIGTYQVIFTFIQPNGVSISFITNASMTANSSSVTVGQASLAVTVVEPIYVVTVNQPFNISVRPIDSITGDQLGQICWNNWTWTANISLHTLSQCNPHGALVISTTSITIVDPMANMVQVTNLMINHIGMYILSIRLVSSNNQYSLHVTSNGILAIANGTVLQTNSGQPLTYVKLAGDYTSLNTSGMLEITRAMIYNGLLEINMPISSDLVLSNGSIVASFLTTSNPVANAQGFSNLSSSTNLAGYSVTGYSYNGAVTSLQSNTQTSNQGSSPSTLNIGVVIGVVIGAVLGASIIVLGTFFGYRAYKNQIKPVRLLDDPDTANSFEPQSLRNDQSSLKIEPKDSALNSPIQKPSPIEHGSNTIRDISVKNPTVSLPVNRVNSPSILNTPRAPSAAISVTMLDFTGQANGQHMNYKMPDVELIKFE
ncbi:unnamed protein product [Rotaria socialis]|uniref:Uncharacterized protein n=1 Tax=Rotaria socialis TaxID=392032 RepID=A0A817N5B6_9BILA|nr:unnamed protein product [Rotaria socialis]CAF4217734.1 unnamed protein product [Rotaria socialis]